MRKLALIAVCVVLTMSAVAIAQDVQTDYDRRTDFSKYRTFM